jgi:hypothetical protein
VLISLDVLSAFWNTIIRIGAVMAIVSLGLNLIYGFNGQFSLGQFGFYAIGAYASADVTYRWTLLHTANGVTVLLMVVVTFVSFLVHLYSIGYMHGDTGYGRFFTFLNLFTFSMLGLVVAPNILQTYVFWELVGVSSFLLIGFYWERQSAAEAAKKAFITTRIGDVGLLIGIILLWRATGTFDIQGIIAGYTGPGTKTIVPREARARLDFRLIPNMQPDAAIRKLKAHLVKHGFGHIEVRAYDGAEPPYKISVKEDISRAIIAAATEVYGDVPVVNGVSAEGAILRHVWIPCVLSCFWLTG